MFLPEVIIFSEAYPSYLKIPSPKGSPCSLKKGRFFFVVGDLRWFGTV
jgi:hypothetical protein